MKTKIFLTILVICFLISCKKTYNCECTGSSVHQMLFNYELTVNETSKSKAEHSCAIKQANCSNQYNTSDPNGLTVVNCHLN